MPFPQELLQEQFADVVPQDSEVHLRSSWNDHPPSQAERSIGTDPLQLADAQHQTISRAHIDTQTDEKQQPAVPSSMPGLEGFVSRMEGMLGGELDRAAAEAEVLEPLSRLAEEGAQEPATCLHFLTAFPRSQAEGERELLEGAQGPMGRAGGKAGKAAREEAASQRKKDLVVTSLSWSCTGQTIAASYGRFDISGWCELPGLLATWNIGKGEVSTTRPDAKVEVDTCLMTTAFHPTHPALIAGGTFTGEVYVWDMSKEGDPQVGRSDALLDVRHTEPVASIAWQYNFTDANKYGSRAHAYRLVTLGNDGRVLVWQWHKMAAPLYGYQLLYQQPGSDRRVVWGGTAMSFQRDPMRAAQATAAARSAKSAGPGAVTPDALNTFMVASEGGRVFRCYHEASDMACADWQKAVLAGEKVELRNPIKDASYQPHSGAAFGVDCSPFARELFLTSGADGSVRLYSSVRGPPLLSAEPSASFLHSVVWSPFRPLVFATAAADGCVYIYDLAASAGAPNQVGTFSGGLLRPVVTMDVNGMRLPCYALAFNPRKPELLATGDATGIQIWRLPSNLSSVRRGEEGLLKKLAAADDASEVLRNMYSP